MKVVLTTLTGEKYEVNVEEHDTVKELKKRFYKQGHASSRLQLHKGNNQRRSKGKVVLQDKQKLSGYQLQDGAVISALFEPDVDIKIKFTFGVRKCNLKVPDSTRVAEVKAKLYDFLSSATGNCDLLYEDVQLEDDLPLHYYDITPGSELYILRPFVNVTIQNNKGGVLYRRVKRTDTIFELKTELQDSKHCGAWQGEGDVDFQLGHPKDLRLFISYRSTYWCKYMELEDDKTVEHYKIKDKDPIHLLSYRWNYRSISKVDVTFYQDYEALCQIEGVEKGDTHLSVRLRVQDQVGVDANRLEMKVHASNCHLRGPGDLVTVNQLSITLWGDV